MGLSFPGPATTRSIGRSVWAWPTTAWTKSWKAGPIMLLLAPLPSIARDFFLYGVE
jgi:hypothetical protein